MSELASSTQDTIEKGKKCIYWPLPDEDEHVCISTITGVYELIENVSAKYSIEKQPYNNSIPNSQLTVIDIDDEKSILLAFIQNLINHVPRARKWFDSTEAPEKSLQFILKGVHTFSLDFDPRRGWFVKCGDAELAFTNETEMSFALEELGQQLMVGSS